MSTAAQHYQTSRRVGTLAQRKRLQRQIALVDAAILSFQGEDEIDVGDTRVVDIKDAEIRLRETRLEMLATIAILDEAQA